MAASSGSLVDWLNGDWGIFFILTAVMVIPSLIFLYMIKDKLKLMTKYFTNNFSVINLYKKPSIKSEIVTQMIYGDGFSLLKKTKKWIKIKIKEDNYKGYILNKKFTRYSIPSHKVAILKAKIYKFPNNQNKIGTLTFGSKIKALGKRAKFLKFEKGWIKNKDVKPFPYKEKTHLKRLAFLKYKI